MSATKLKRCVRLVVDEIIEQVEGITKEVKDLKEHPEHLEKDEINGRKNDKRKVSHSGSEAGIH